MSPLNVDMLLTTVKVESLAENAKADTLAITSNVNWFATSQPTTELMFAQLDCADSSTPDAEVLLPAENVTEVFVTKTNALNALN